MFVIRDWKDEFIISPELNINNPENFEVYQYKLIGVAYSRNNNHFICRYLDIDGTTVYENDAMKNSGNSILLNPETPDQDLFPSFFTRNDRIQNTNDFFEYIYKANCVLYRLHLNLPLDIISP